VVIVSAMALVLHSMNFGSIVKSELILRFRISPRASDAYQQVLDKFTRQTFRLRSSM